MVVIGDSNMGINRRKVLTALGGITIGGGALFGTGAFSQVEADRSAEFTVKSDSNALLGLSGDGTYVTEDASGTNSNSIIQIAATDLNDDATTTLGTVTISNNGGDGSKWVYVGGGADGNSAVEFVADSDQDTTGDSADNVSEGDSVVGSSNNVEIADQSSLTVEIEVDTSAGDPSSVDTVIFTANDTDQS